MGVRLTVAHAEMSRSMLDREGRPLADGISGIARKLQELAGAHQQMAAELEALRNEPKHYHQPNLDSDSAAAAAYQAPAEKVRLALGAALADFDVESAHQADFREELERCAAQAERLRAGVLAAAEERSRLNAGIAKFEAAA